jgi:hypothetical protein
MRAFSLKPPMRIPLTAPMTAATPTAVAMAIIILSLDCWPTPTMIKAEIVIVPGTLRSIPAVIITSI